MTAFELIYTSAPRGLKTGTVGFATVAQTRGIPAKLAAALESLSGTRRVSGSVRRGENGDVGRVVARSQTRWTLDGRRWLVFSRIVDAGLDYSGRSNLLAHHWAFEESGTEAEGVGRRANVDPVAFWRLEDEFFRREWRGEPRLSEPFDVGSDLARRVCEPVAPAICRRWAAATGDVGWGGIWAASASSESSRALLVAGADVDATGLFVEALALLRPEFRRLVSFATQESAVSPNVEVRWRAVLPETFDRLAGGDGGLRGRDASTTVFELASNEPSSPIRGVDSPEDWARRAGVAGSVSIRGIAAARKGESFDPRPESARAAREIRRAPVPLAAKSDASSDDGKNDGGDAPRFVNLREFRDRRREPSDANADFFAALGVSSNGTAPQTEAPSEPDAATSSPDRLSEYYASLAAKNGESNVAPKRRRFGRIVGGVAITAAALGAALALWLFLS